MKKVLSLIISAMLLVGSFSTIGVYASPQITVTLNGTYINFDVQPTEINGRVLVPVRAIFEALGAKVDWNESKNEVIATKGDVTIRLYKDNTTMYRNNNAITLDVPAKDIGDRILVPVRAISESFGCKVEWSDTNSQVIITTNNSSTTYSKEEIIQKVKALGYSTAYEYPIPDYISVTGASKKSNLSFSDGYSCNYDSLYKMKSDVISYCKTLEKLGFVPSSVSETTLHELENLQSVWYKDHNKISYMYPFGDSHVLVIISWLSWDKFGLYQGVDGSRKAAPMLYVGYFWSY